MNIALLHYSVPPIVGGVESVIAQHARLMHTDGHQLRLIAARGEAAGEGIPLITLPLTDSQHPDVLAVKAQLDMGQVPPAFYALRDQLRQELAPALAGVDVLIAHNVCSLNKNLALTAAVHQLQRLPDSPRLILWHHDLAWTTPRYQTELHAGYPWDLLRTDWGQTTQVVISELRRHELAALMNLDPACIQVIPNGVDLARFYKLEPQTQTLLAQSRLLDSAPILLLPVRVTPRKNIELALHVLAELQKSFPRATLIVTGPPGPHNRRNHDYFQSLLALRAKLNLQTSAHFLAEHSAGYLPDEVVADFYRVADALILPSREEGFGIPLLEAGLSHLPVFCADISPLRDLGLHAANYFSPEADPPIIAAMLARHFQASAITNFAERARTLYRWDLIYRQKIAPLLQ